MRGFVHVEVPKKGYVEHDISYRNVGGRVCPFVANSDDWEYIVETFVDAIPQELEAYRFEGPLEAKFVFKLGKSDEPYADYDHPDLTLLSRAFLQAMFWLGYLKPEQISFMAVEKVNADPQGVLVRIKELMPKCS